MRGPFATLFGRLALLQLAIHAVLPPILFFHLDSTLRASAFENFTHHGRAYARSLANELEAGDVLESPSRTVVFLDGSVEGGECVYSAVSIGERLLGSSVAETPDWIESRGDDASNTGFADNVYAVATPFHRDGRSGTLYLGFDAGPTLAQVHGIRYRIILALGAYVIASMIATIAFVRIVSRPLTQLQRASARVAGGDAAARLSVDSTTIEIVALARDLEHMRAELVGAAATLRAEMSRRESEHAERVRLERHLRHEQRLATLGTFAGGVAHEFNNILLPLILYTEDALDQLDAEHPVRGNLERVLAGAARAANVVARILAFSRPVGEQAPEPIHLAAVVEEAVGLFRALIPASIELKTEIGARDETVLGNSTLLHQVVINLCSNAARAMRDSGGTLLVTLNGRTESDATTPLAARRRVLVLTVKDTGHGMDAATREKIFEPFFTSRARGEGTGLGLSIVHAIVTGLGGTIEVASEVGIGTEFVVTLPAHSDPAPST